MKLIRSALTTACLLATAWAVAAPSPVRMDGETLPQEFVGQMTKSERLKEYVAADETFEYQTGRNGFIESNVFRYWKGREGLYSVQFARRSPLSSLDGNKAKDLANQNVALIQEIANVDKRQVEKALMLR